MRALSALTMSFETLYNLIIPLWYAIPVIVVIACIFLISNKISYFLRSIIGVMISWFLLLIFSLYIYNPVGIKMGYEIGMDSPEMKFDNNTFASTLIGGWMFPTLLAIILFVVLKTLNKKLKNGRLTAAL